MIVVIIIVIVGALIIGPQYWVKSILERYNKKDEANFTGTGGEFAEHMLKLHSIDNVTIETTDVGDHYDPISKTVRLTSDKFNGKTLTAITVAAHECGHAIQDHEKHPLFTWRTRLAGLSNFATKLGSFLLFTAPILALITRAPSIAIINITGAFLILGFGIALHFLTLPVEIDASFNKALPFLAKGYLSPLQQKAANKILKAAAYTYVAASLSSLLNFWRWLSVLKR
ncbi:MAG: zinc metallopeptidase [Gammaproteobacteria bacterium]|nr:zinc metallopeptidase [Gammaproteobacteria bacterium]